MPVPVAALVGLGGQLAASGIGEYLAGLDEAEQERLLQAALDEYGNLSVPKLERIVAEQTGPSRFDSIQTDPQLRQAQMEALEALQREARGGGMTLEDRATYNEAQNRAARSASGAMGRIREGLETRGMGGSGTETALQFGAAADQAARTGDAALRTAADSRKRALDSMLAAGRLGGDIRGQDYGEKSRAAQAADAIARYNADSRSKAGFYNAGLGQQDYDNRFGLAGAKASGLRSQAALAGQRAQGKRQLWGGIGSTIGGAGVGTQDYLALGGRRRQGSSEEDDENPWNRGGF